MLKLEDMLDDFVYKKIWDSLSSQDRDIALAITDDEMKVKDMPAYRLELISQASLSSGPRLLTPNTQ